MEHDVSLLRIGHVYSYVEKINLMIEQAGLQLILGAYHFRRTQTTKEQKCSWCKKTIGTNKEHFYMNNLSDENEPVVRMHMGRCLQEYLTETLNKATQIFQGKVDNRWESLVYPEGKPHRRI